MARGRESLSDNFAAGTAALRGAKAHIGDTIAMVGERGEDALRDLRGVGETLVEGIEDALHERPIVTVGVAIGVGFLLGAAWRR
jgi:ElaB/YqjD/DUF883 family membrane-anchored ribosome-binding protein